MYCAETETKIGVHPMSLCVFSFWKYSMVNSNWGRHDASPQMKDLQMTNKSNAIRSAFATLGAFVLLALPAVASPDGFVRGFATGQSGFSGQTTRNNSDSGMTFSRGKEATSTSANTEGGDTGSARVTGYYEQETGGEAMDIHGDHNRIVLQSNSAGDAGGEALVERDGDRVTDDAAYADGISAARAEGTAVGNRSVVTGRTVATNRGAIDARANEPGHNSDDAVSRSYGASTTHARATDRRNAKVTGGSVVSADSLTDMRESDAGQ
jgi:hypothetical protein